MSCVLKLFGECMDERDVLLGFAQWMAPVRPKKLALRWSKSAAKCLIGPALAQRVGAAFDQLIDLLRR